MGLLSGYLEVIRKYALFTGRARKREFWFYVLTTVLIVSAFYFATGLTMAWLEDGFVRQGAFDFGWYELYLDVFTWTGRAYALYVVLPSLAVSARRLHDSGRSAWWVLLLFVPVVGVVTLIVLYCFDGEPGDNRYGPDPKRISLESSEIYAGSGVSVR